ncbi:hypothetical protein RAA17_14150 [Komagataeibacter rhaeticus]|nr:hypothetical protein [Komagataeibacter rhaeticus]
MAGCRRRRPSGSSWAGGRAGRRAGGGGDGGAARRCHPVRAARSGLRGSGRAVRDFGVILTVTTGFFFAHNLVYTYIAPVLVAHGLPQATLSLDLLAIGVCSLAGLWGAGQLVDASPRLGMLGAGALLLAGIGLLVGHATSGIGSVAAGAVWCAGYAGAIPFFMSGAIRTQATTGDIAGAAVNATSNIGILLGSAVGAGCWPCTGRGAGAHGHWRGRAVHGAGGGQRQRLPTRVVHEDEDLPTPCPPRPGAEWRRLRGQHGRGKG